MSSRKYVGPAIICRPKTGENMSAQKKKFGGAAPEPPRGGPPTPPSYPPARPAQALRHYYSCKEYNTYPTHSGRHSQNCRNNTCAHCSFPVCAQVWRRVVVAVFAASRFRFWLGVSLGYGLDSLISSCLVIYPWRNMCHPLFGYLA
jgi:hypothetical protein